jgi:hypothetical protein
MWHGLGTVPLLVASDALVLVISWLSLKTSDRLNLIESTQYNGPATELEIDESKSCRELGCLGFTRLTISSRKSSPHSVGY